MSVSIILCTYNHAVSLKQTLTAMQALQVPDGVAAELLIVDNASTDDTHAVAQAAALPQLTVRYLFEPRKGKGYAYNAGLAAANGDILLFTDDDVRVPADWIAGMIAPIVEGRADAVAGGVRLAPHLQRDWLTPVHKAKLADTGLMRNEAPGMLVGANMAFSRRILARVPGFDPELGPGALGFHDEGLFGEQLQLAGFRLGGALDTIVEHHPESNRLLRSSWLHSARAFGRSSAYMLHHWHHGTMTWPYLRLLRKQAQLALWRLRHKIPPDDSEGMALEEIGMQQNIFQLQQYLIERKRPHNYQKRGLVKIEGVRDERLTAQTGLPAGQIDGSLAAQPEGNGG